MAWFTVETTYAEDRGRLDAARPRHREYISALVERRKVAVAGPWADDSAGFVIYQVADRDELDRLLADDPYTTEGVAAARTVHEWKPLLGSVGPA